MESSKVVARHKGVRHSPLKMRVVANAAKKMSLDEAIEFLAFSRKKSAAYIHKVLVAVVANAENNHDLKREDLRIAEIQIGQDRIYRRPKYRARGRMDIMRSKFSNIRIVLEGKK